MAKIVTGLVWESIEGEPLPGVTILRAAQVATEACGRGLRLLSLGWDRAQRRNTLRIEWTSSREEPLPGARAMLLPLLR